MTFDWSGFQRESVDALVQAVRSTVAGNPDERFYGAALHMIYAETDGVIMLPMLSMNAEDALADLPAEQRAGVRWCPAADWAYNFDEWLPEGRARSWESAITAEACRGTPQRWESTFDRYLTALVRICKQARTALRTAGVVDRHFLVLPIHEERYDSLLKRCLTKGEVSRHFPELDEQAVERARVAELPEAERIAFYVSKLDSFEGPILAEDAAEALVEIGPAAFPVLTAMLELNDGAWAAAKLLADIGRPDDGVIGALDAALIRPGQSEQTWISCALSRLGRLQLVLDRFDRLEDGAAVAAVAAPLTGFRDHAVSPLPLDYRPVEDFIARYPQCTPALVRKLEPGRGYCQITAPEVDEAIRGLTSPHVVIRRHATCALGDRSLGVAAAKRVLPLLARVVEHDPDASVRRLAILSLLWWQKDSRPYADVVSSALNDPAAEVRDTAADWLREQDASPAK